MGFFSKIGKPFKKFGNWVGEHKKDIATAGLLGPGMYLTGKAMGMLGGGGGEDPSQPQGPDLTEYQNETKRLSEELEKGGYDPAKQQRFYEEAKSPIESAVNDQANQVSSYLARQGLGGSGINISAHSKLAANKAALESSAMRQATGMAEQARRQELLDSFTTKTAGIAPVLQKYGIDINAFIALKQAQIAKDAANKQMFGDIGKAAGAGLGFIYGGPAGAAVGGAAGGTLGSEMPDYWS